MIERRLENLLALDYPADRVEIVVASDASSDRTNELVEAVAAREPRVRLLDCPRGGKVAAQDRAVRETGGEVVAFSDANATLGAGRAATARRDARRPGGRLRLRPAAARGRGRWEPRGPLLALRALAPRAGVPAGLGHGRQRLDLRAAPRRLRRGRPALGPRPRVPVPDGAGRPSRGLRARGAGVRAADADERDRVRAQGADVRALLGDHAARLDAPPAAARVPRRDALAPRPALRERRAPPRPRRDERRAGADRLAVRGRPPRPARAPRGLRRARPHRPLLPLRDVGDGPQALANYLRHGVRPPGIPRGRRGEPPRRRRARGDRPRPREPGARGGRCGDQARGRRAGALPADARRQGRPRLRGAEAPLDGRRRRAARGGVRRRPRRRADHPRRPGPGARRSTSCRSSGTSCAATCPSSARGRRSATRSSGTTRASGAASRSGPASPAGRRYTAARRCPWADRIELDVWYVEHRSRCST